MSQVEKLGDTRVQEALKGLADWSLVGEAIQRTYQFTDFQTAMRFVAGVADAAEQAQHHPDILIRYSRVTLTLATHDAGGITEKDFALAAACDALAAKWPTPPAPGGATPKPSRKKK